MSKEWFIKEGGQVCFKSDNAELNGWDIQSLVDCLNGKEIKISDLEAKLAEKDAELLQKEKKIQDLMLCEFVATTLDFNKLSADNCRLREQLAMQENTITNLIEDNRASQEWYKKQLAEKDKEIMEFASKVDLLESEKENLFRTLEEVNEEHQDKISFAVEQLEKVKEFYTTPIYDIQNPHTDVRVLLQRIDNQIKQLKEGK